MSCHMFISPHLDDVVLSCGGTIAHLTRSGEKVYIVTTMAGEPPLGLPRTPLIDAIRKRWQSGRNLVAARRLEDALAADALGAQVIHFPIYESAFRTARSGSGAMMPLYPTEASAYGDLNPGDDAHIMLLEMGCPCRDVRTVYAPLCADEHIDHRIARDWAVKMSCGGALTQLRLYEEFPAAGATKDRASVKRALSSYREQLPPYTLELVTQPLTPEETAAKIHALRAYDAHFKVLWNSAEAMESSVRAFMAQSSGSAGSGQTGALNPAALSGAAERFWNATLA